MKLTLLIICLSTFWTSNILASGIDSTNIKIDEPSACNNYSEVFIEALPYREEIVIDTYDITSGVINDVCKRVFDSYKGQFVCKGALGLGALFFSAATEGASYEDYFQFNEENYYYQIYNCGEHIHCSLSTDSADDASYKGCGGCN